MGECVKIQTQLYSVYIEETHFRFKDRYMLKLKECRKILHINGKQKKAGMAVSTSNKINFKFEIIARNLGVRI